MALGCAAEYKLMMPGWAVAVLFPPDSTAVQTNVQMLFHLKILTWRLKQRPTKVLLWVLKCILKSVRSGLQPHIHTGSSQGSFFTHPSFYVCCGLEAGLWCTLLLTSGSHWVRIAPKYKRLCNRWIFYQIGVVKIEQGQMIYQLYQLFLSGSSMLRFQTQAAEMSYLHRVFSMQLGWAQWSHCS